MTEEIHGKPWYTCTCRSQDLPDAKWILTSSPALNTRDLSLVPTCAVVLFEIYKGLSYRALFCTYYMDEKGTNLPDMCEKVLHTHTHARTIEIEIQGLLHRAQNNLGYCLAYFQSLQLPSTQSGSPLAPKSRVSFYVLDFELNFSFFIFRSWLAVTWLARV
jgi:hypothetical protein